MVWLFLGHWKRINTRTVNRKGNQGTAVNAYQNEVKRGQDEYDNEQRRLHNAGFWDITDGDIKAFTERLKKAEREKVRT